MADFRIVIGMPIRSKELFNSLEHHVHKLGIAPVPALGVGRTFPESILGILVVM